MARKALGRGLRALIPDAHPGDKAGDSRETLERGPNRTQGHENGADWGSDSDSARNFEHQLAQERLLSIPIGNLIPNSRQPRTHWDVESLKGLARSIEANGLLEPILVRPRGDKFEIIAGERRWRSCKLAGLKEVPAVVRNLEDQQSLESALIENIQRADLNPVDEARAYDQLSREFGLTHEQIARRVGKDRSTVTNLLRLLGLSEDILQYVSRETLSLGHARVLLALPESDREAVAKRIVEESWSVRDAETWAKANARKQQVSPRRRQSRNKRKTEDVLRLEEELARQLSAEVQLRPARQGGKLEIRYHDDEDLSRLLDRFGVVVS